jgi:hypothetical protein
MSERQPQRTRRFQQRVARWIGGCLLLFFVAAAVTIVLMQVDRESQESRSERDVPLGVEEAIIVSYSGPRLIARPYRRGASVNLRIANEVQRGKVGVYDVRYVVNLPGEFDLTDYLTTADGSPIENLPSFHVRGLTSLTKDIETRIQEIENVQVHIWHWYYESLGGLGIFWALWLCGLIFLGRPPRKRREAPPPPPPSTAERIEHFLQTLVQRELSTVEKAEFEVVLLEHWRAKLGLRGGRMAVACRQIQRSPEWGGIYQTLQAWLHTPDSRVGAEAFLANYRRTGTESREKAGVS